MKLKPSENTIIDMILSTGYKSIRELIEINNEIELFNTLKKNGFKTKINKPGIEIYTETEKDYVGILTPSRVFDEAHIYFNKFSYILGLTNKKGTEQLKNLAKKYTKE